MGFSFLALLGITGDIISIGDAARRLFANPERSAVENYIRYLEPKNVLYAEIDQENKQAVISSMEKIKYETEKLRAMINDHAVRKSMSRLINVMSDELSNLWAYDTLHRNGQAKMFMSLQRFRTEMARTLAMLCYAYDISPAKTELQQFIINLATVRPINQRQ